VSTAPPDLHAIEWHDAVFSQLLMLTDGEARLAFSQLTTYFFTAEDRRTVVSRDYRAELHLRGVRSLEATSPIEPRNLASAGRMKTRQGVVPLASALDWCAVVRVELQFTSGAQLSIDCSEARLEIDFTSEPVVSEGKPRPVT
jgi:hypothetical protein